jgi:DNA-binding XRE family transcriptional regulator
MNQLKLKSKIAEVRINSGLNKHQVTRFLGTHNQSWYDRIEKGRATPTVKTALLIAKVLGARVEDLYELTEE